MKIAKESSLEMYQMPNGNYGVLLNGNLIAKVVNCGERASAVEINAGTHHTIDLGWQVMSQTAAHKNGRKRYEDPQKAVKTYFGRKAIVIDPSMLLAPKVKIITR
jgi:hypothetical protein